MPNYISLADLSRRFCAAGKPCNRQYFTNRAKAGLLDKAVRLTSGKRAEWYMQLDDAEALLLSFTPLRKGQHGKRKQHGSA